MATKIIKAWIDGSIQEIEVEDIVSPEQPLSYEDRLGELEDKPIITDGNLLVGNGTTDLEEMTPEEVLSHINGASVVTMTTEEYEALDDEESNANTLYMLTDSDDDDLTPYIIPLQWVYDEETNEETIEYANNFVFNYEEVTNAITEKQYVTCVVYSNGVIWGIYPFTGYFPDDALIYFGCVREGMGDNIEINGDGQINNFLNSTDSNLLSSCIPADAKAVGDKINELYQKFDNLENYQSGITSIDDNNGNITLQALYIPLSSSDDNQGNVTITM